ncbi:MAG: hypothetical protein NVS2B12_28590 [Ktedonobacteraceae bacterium]
MKVVVRWQPLALWGLALLGLGLRLYNVNWDQGNNFHPDERQILFHVVAFKWPTGWGQFFDPAQSPLNPHFFAYGSFPLYLLALVAHLVDYNLSDPANFVKITLVGRVISAIFDSGTILLVGWLTFLLARAARPDLSSAWRMALFAAALVVFTPLQLQLSHFYAVDTMLVFFVTLTLVAGVGLARTEKVMRWSFVAGLAYGLALATKFSAAPLAIPLGVGLYLHWQRRRDSFEAALALLLAAALTALIFFLVQPYALLDWPNFVQQVSEQSTIARGTFDVPFIRQFAGTIPYVYQIQNIVLWGMGLLAGVSALLGFFWLGWQSRDPGHPEMRVWWIVLSWIAVYGAITGGFYVKFMRYMLPIYPALTVVAAAALFAWLEKLRWDASSARARLNRAAMYMRPALLLLVLAGTMFQGLALLNVYSAPNTRVEASLWIYAHLAPGSVLTYEQWDDPLPVASAGHDPARFVQATYTNADGQTVTGLDLYGDDTPQKAQLLAQLLPKLNAITMATDRLDKSIPRLPARYPLTIHYYQLLYSGQLGFHLAAQFDNRPHLFGVTLDDSNTDESYSVFDHPTARVFVRATPYPYTTEQLLHKLLDGVKL